MISLFRFFSRWPLWALHAAGALLGWAAYALSAPYRQRLGANAGFAKVSAADRSASVAQAGKLVAEMPRLWLGSMPATTWANANGLRQLLAQCQADRRGVLFITPHMGSFEATGRSLAEQFFSVETPLVVLYRPPRKAWLRPVVEGARSKPGMRAVPTDLGGVKTLLKTLRAGGAVGILPDQVPPAGMGEFAPFFGQPAYTMTLVARLCSQTQPRLVMTWGERLGRGRGYAMRWREMDALQGDTQAMVAQLNAEVERTVRECPSQYLWGYARYKQPRQDPT